VLNLAILRQTLERCKGERDRVERDLAKTTAEHDRLVTEGERIEEAQALLQEVARQTQQALEYRLGELVTLALEALWPGQEWRFRVRYELRRGRTEADLLFEDAEGHDVDPMTADGGGAVDVAGKMLQVACWSLRRPRSRAVMVWDEPFRCLSSDLQPKMSAVLRELSERLGLQFIIVTHEEELLEAADRVFRVQKSAKGSKVV